MANHLNCDTLLLREKDTDDGKIAEYLVREKVMEDDFCEVRYAKRYFLNDIKVFSKSLFCAKSHYF